MSKIHSSLINNKKFMKLAQILKGLGEPLYIACSGGLDSRFLAFAAQYIGIKNIHLLHITGVHIDKKESHDLQEWAIKHQFPIHNIALDILADKNIKHNVTLRCYHCKYSVFSTMLSFCGHSTLCDGTHFDDTKSHRPGLRALQELNINSPLAKSELNKTDIRAFAKEIGLDNPNQKAKPCLLTRFDYGALITQKKLDNVAFAESTLLELLRQEFEQGECKKECKANEFKQDEFKQDECDENTLPDFRIREITPSNYELHSVQIIPPSIIHALQKALQKANIPFVQYKQIKTLSNYFDQNKQI